MRVYLLERKQFIPKDINEVFGFFNQPENLETITPTSLGFKILTPKPIKMMTGAVIDYAISIMGIPVRWTSIITDYEPPYKFVDTQIRGPYSLWHHTHKFEEIEGGTQMTDTVRYAIAMTPIGEIAHTLFVKNQLKHIFDYRKEVITKAFE